MSYSYSLIGYDHTYDMTINYGIFSSRENVNKAIEELVRKHLKDIADSDWYKSDKNMLYYDEDLMEEEEKFRNTLHIIKNGEMDKLMSPTI
jgi:hypothetical protein